MNLQDVKTAILAVKDKYQRYSFIEYEGNYNSGYEKGRAQIIGFEYDVFADLILIQCLSDKKEIKSFIVYDFLEGGFVNVSNVKRV